MNTAAAVPVQIIQAVVRRFPAVVPLMGEQARNVLKAQVSYAGIRATWWLTVFDAVHDYLTSDRPVTSFANAMKRGVAEAFFPAAEIAYEDGGGSLPLDEDTAAWLVGEQNAELAHIDDLFARLKAEWEGIDPENEALARAEGYASRLDGLYAEAKTRAAGNKMLTFDGSDGKESCPECKKMKGQRHRASWWVKNGMIPGPGNTNYTCNGFNCEHRLFDDDGNEWTA